MRHHRSSTPFIPPTSKYLADVQRRARETVQVRKEGKVRIPCKTRLIEYTWLRKMKPQDLSPTPNYHPDADARSGGDVVPGASARHTLHRQRPYLRSRHPLCARLRMAGGSGVEVRRTPAGAAKSVPS